MAPLLKDGSVSGPTIFGNWRADRKEGTKNIGIGLRSNCNPMRRRHIRHLRPGGTGPDREVRCGNVHNCPSAKLSNA